MCPPRILKRKKKKTSLAFPCLHVTEFSRTACETTGDDSDFTQAAGLLVLEQFSRALSRNNHGLETLNERLEDEAFARTVTLSGIGP